MSSNTILFAIEVHLIASDILSEHLEWKYDNNNTLRILKR